MVKILFVCTGNICRSPTAHAIARHLAKKNNLDNQFIFDSAGTQSYHIGESTDSRSARVGKEKGISFNNIFSRKITNEDFKNFDLIFAMDRSHLSHLKRICPAQYHNKIKLFLEFCETENNWNNEVIDPYYDGSQGFYEVSDVIESAINNFFKTTLNNNLK